MKVKTNSKKVNKAWLNDHVNDPYVKQAQKDGYRARAAYKLKEINDKDRLIKPGMTVLIVLKQDQRTGKLTKGVVKDILTKNLGTSNAHNVIHATIDALRRLRSPAQIAAARGKTVEEVTN